MERNVRTALPFYLVILLWGVGSGILTPVFPLYIRSLGFSIEEWGGLVMVYAVGTFVFEWAWGALSDRVDRRLFIAAGLSSGSVLVFLYTLGGSKALFYVLQFLRGALFIMVGPAVKALVSDMNSSGSIGLSMGLYSSVRRLGRAVGPIFGSFLATYWSYEHALYAYSAIYLIGAAITMLIFKVDGGSSALAKERHLSIIQDCSYLLTTGTIAILFVIPVIIFMGTTAIRSYLPIYSQEVIGMSTIEIGALFSVSNVIGFLTTPVFGWLSDALGRRRVVLSSFLLSAISLFGFTLVKTSLQLTLALVIFRVISSPITPLVLAMLTDVTPRRLMGASMGIYSTFENLGIVLAPPIYSVIWSAYAPGAIFLFSALTQMIGVLLILLKPKAIR
ncbi:MAG: MFS transporter [Candidatus Bathyarchaeota archaeon]|nr:MFS transporter [Candidatus Bathyarchaeota archaeon]MCW3991597.1 MFS transporter [Candidatus Bathyarchaeota archaeon]